MEVDQLVANSVEWQRQRQQHLINMQKLGLKRKYENYYIIIHVLVYYIIIMISF